MKFSDAVKMEGHRKISYPFATLVALIVDPSPLLIAAPPNTLIVHSSALRSSINEILNSSLLLHLKW